MTALVITPIIFGLIADFSPKELGEFAITFPIIIKSGVNQQGKNVRYIFNYSAVPQQIKYAFGNGTELLSEKAISKNITLDLEAWGVKIIEEN